VHAWAVYAHSSPQATMLMMRMLKCIVSSPRQCQAASYTYKLMHQATTKYEATCVHPHRYDGHPDRYDPTRGHSCTPAPIRCCSSFHTQHDSTHVPATQHVRPRPHQHAVAARTKARRARAQAPAPQLMRPRPYPHGACSLLHTERHTARLCATHARCTKGM
jgi:hypothetical protein